MRDHEAEYRALFGGAMPPAIEGVPTVKCADGEQELARRTAVSAYLDWIGAARRAWRARVVGAGDAPMLGDTERALKRLWAAQRAVYLVEAGIDPREQVPPPPKKKAAPRVVQYGFDDLIADIMGGA
jgi:hypothetical protein